MSRNGNLEGIFTFLFLALMINGCVHSCNKHKDDPAWLAYSPVAAYRGAEFFWHDDFAGVNWEERIKDDVSTTVALMSASTQTYEIDNVKKQIEKFSEKISKYPSDKRKEIQKGVQQFFKFNKYATDDLANYINNFNPEAPFVLSNKTLILLDSLDKYYNIGGVKAYKDGIDSFCNSIRNDAENISIYQERVNSHKNYDIDTYSKVYSRIFKEEFVLPE